VSAIKRVGATGRKRIVCAALIGLWPCILCAQAGAPSLQIAAESPLSPGPARLEVWVDPGDSREQPLMLDVASEGEALQVVRGRFRRVDAEPDAGRLRFSVPIVVRAQGTAIVRATLRTYRCTPDCREAQASTQRTVTIGPSAGPSDATP
jgi:hypothetical protein